jgi:cytochrome c biogenesis protein CcdA
VTASVLLAVTAGALGAVNPCGFALLPAYLSVLVAGQPPRGARAAGAAVARALRCTAALTTGYVLVFGAFGLLLAPFAGRLRPTLPWLTVALGLALVAAGAWLAAGRSLPTPATRLPAARLTRSVPSMVLFGAGYAVASLGCAIGPFLAIVVAGVRAGTPAQAVLLLLGYAAGMGLVVAVAALATALLRVSVIGRIRRFGAVAPRLGGAVLLLSGGYVAYYGWYEYRAVADPRGASGDPVVATVLRGQREVAGILDAVGPGWLLVVLAGLLVVGWAAARHGGRATAFPAAGTRPRVDAPAAARTEVHDG